MIVRIIGEASWNYPGHTLPNSTRRMRRWPPQCTPGTNRASSRTWHACWTGSASWVHQCLKITSRSPASSSWARAAVSPKSSRCPAKKA